MRPLQLRKLSAFRGVVGKLIVGEQSPWNYVSSHRKSLPGWMRVARLGLKAIGGTDLASQPSHRARLIRGLADPWPLACKGSVRWIHSVVTDPLPALKRPQGNLGTRRCGSQKSPRSVSVLIDGCRSVRRN